MDNLELLRDGTNQIINENRLELVDEMFINDFVDHDGSVTRDREGFKTYFAELRAAFPDYKFTIEHEMGSGDYVLQRVSFEGTHRGPFNGLPPTGKWVKIGGFDLFRVSDGKVAEHWAQFDTMGMLQQLGVMPPPDAGPAAILGTVFKNIGRGVAGEIRTRLGKSKS